MSSPTADRPPAFAVCRAVADIDKKSITSGERPAAADFIMRIWAARLIAIRQRLALRRHCDWALCERCTADDMTYIAADAADARRALAAVAHATGNCLIRHAPARRQAS